MAKKAPNELGTEKIGKLLMMYAVPAVIAMTASSLYNMVDSIFIGRGVGPLAIYGLAVTFTIMNLSAAFGAMVGVGGSTLMSVKLGQKDYDVAEKVLGNVVMMNIIVGIAFAVVAIIFLDPILIFFGASENTVGYARQYMFIILLGNVVTHLYLGLNSIIRSTGHPNMAMIATIATVIVNAILDPIFIYVFKWGIAGAAIATIIAQVISLVFVVHVLSDKSEAVHFKQGIFKLKKRIIKNITAIGLSPFCMQICACMVVILINKGLKEHGGDLAIGAYGIVNRIVFLFVMIVLGITQGMQPIAGYNFGAQKYERVTQVFKYACIYATIVMTCAFIIGEFFPDAVVRLFTTDETLIRIANEGMRIVVVTYPIVGFQMVTGNFFQSLGMAKKSIFISVTRQLLFLVPLLVILPPIFGTKGVWMSMPIADCIAVVIAAVMLHRFYKSGSFKTQTSR